jgi:hypothetical protein
MASIYDTKNYNSDNEVMEKRAPFTEGIESANRWHPVCAEHPWQCRADRGSQRACRKHRGHGPRTASPHRDHPKRTVARRKRPALTTPLNPKGKNE